MRNVKANFYYYYYYYNNKNSNKNNKLSFCLIFTYSLSLSLSKFNTYFKCICNSLSFQFQGNFTMIYLNKGIFSIENAHAHKLYESNPL